MDPNEQSSLWTYIKACAQYRWLHSEEIFLALSADLLNINTGFARQFNFQTAYDTPQSKLTVNDYKSLLCELIVELVANFIFRWLTLSLLGQECSKRRSCCLY